MRNVRDSGAQIRSECISPEPGSVHWALDPKRQGGSSVFLVNTDRQTSRLLAGDLTRLVRGRHSLPKDLHEPRICEEKCQGHG